MKVTLLGTGTSCGVPVIGCNCKVCTSNNPHDSRLRTSAVIESQTTRILIDCGPDFREQMLRYCKGLDFYTKPRNLTATTKGKIDAVFITHIHYDHAGGIDDLRPFCVFGDINIYSNERVISDMHHTLPYLFAENKYPGIPRISAHAYKNHDTIKVGDIEVKVFTVNHGKLPISAFRVGNFAYITDMKTIDDEERPFLEGIETLVVNALRYSPGHDTHLLVDEAIDFANTTSAKRVFLTHICHDIGLHDEVNRQLPPHIQLGFDGQTFNID